MRCKDITGQRFGRLTAIRWEGWTDTWGSRWLCRCDCGKEVSVLKNNLMRGKTQSCGCLRRDLMKQRHHGPAVEQE